MLDSELLKVIQPFPVNLPVDDGVPPVRMPHATKHCSHEAIAYIWECSTYIWFLSCLTALTSSVSAFPLPSSVATLTRVFQCDNLHCLNYNVICPISTIHPPLPLTESPAQYQPLHIPPTTPLARKPRKFAREAHLLSAQLGLHFTLSDLMDSVPRPEK